MSLGEDLLKPLDGPPEQAEAAHLKLIAHAVAATTRIHYLLNRADCPQMVAALLEVHDILTGARWSPESSGGDPR